MQCFMVVCLDISTPRNVEANCFHFFLAPARHLRAHSPMTRRFTSCGDFPKYFDRKSKVGLTYKIFWKKVQIREVAPVLIKCYNQLFWFPSSEIWLDFGVKIIFQKIELFICLWYNLASVIFLLHYFSIFSLLEWPNLSWVYFSHFLCFGHSIGQWWMPISIENRSPLKVRRWKK